MKKIIQSNKIDNQRKAKFHNLVFNRRLDIMTDDRKPFSIPSTIKEIQPYSGSPNGLRQFIQHVDDVLNLHRLDYEGDTEEVKRLKQTVIIRTIRAKIIGKANDAIELYNANDSWDDIKRNLISLYSDKRSETCLIRDLHFITQKNDDIETYFAKISEILNSLNTWASLNTPTNLHADVITAKRSWYHSMCLAVYLAGLKEPLGSMVRSMQPEDLPTARIYCIKEQNIGHLRNKASELTNRITNYKPNLPPRAPIYPNYNRFPIRQNFNSYQSPQNGQQPQYYNHRPFTQQNSNQFGNSRGFPPKPKPEPMDTSSIPQSPRHPPFQQKNFNPNPYRFNTYGPPRFQSKELFNMDYNYYHSPEEYPEYDQHTDYCNSQEITGNNPEQEEILDSRNIPSIEIQDEDFHQDASAILTDT